jgi:hypothetical protein
LPAYPVTVDALVGSIRRRAFLPQDGDGSDTTSTLALMNESIYWMQSFIMAERQGHYRRVIDVALVGGQQDYSLPIRAAGTEGEIVVPVDSQGNPIDQMLVRDDVEWGAMYPPSQTASYPWRYFWMANAIRVYPPPAGAGYSLRIFYPQRVSQLVLAASTFQVTQNNGGGVLTIAPLFTGLTPPSGDFRPNAVASGNPNASLWAATSLVDLVHATPPFDIGYQELPIVSLSKTLPTPVIAGGGSGATFGTLVFNSVGGVTSVPVTGGGSGYTPGQVVTLTGNGQNFSGITVGSGALTGITILNPGTGYCDGTSGATQITVTAPTGDAGLSKVVVGDYLCLADTAPVLTWTMLEAAPVFAQFCATKLLEARKDPQAYATAKDALSLETARFQALLAPRMRQQHNKVITGLGQFRWGARRTRPLGGYLR